MFIDLGGNYPDNDFTAVIFAGDAAKFPNASALDGKTVAISGRCSSTRPARDHPEIGGSAQSEIAHLPGHQT